MTQYVAANTDDERMAREFRAIQGQKVSSSVPLPDHWDDADFARIAKSIDDVIEARGWQVDEDDPE